MKKVALVALLLLVCTFIGCGGGSGGNGGGGNNPPTLQSISVSGANSTIALGQTQQYSATGHYSDSSSKDLTATATWSSSPAGQISSSGLFTAKTIGVATVTASSGSISGSTTVTVGPAALVSITISPSNSVAAGVVEQLSAIGLYTDGSSTQVSNVTWTSSNTAVATVSSTGSLTALAVGTSNITATSGSIVGTLALTVTPPALVSIAVTPVNPSIFAGQSQQFTATGTLTDRSTQNLTTSVTWQSSNTSVATIAAGGLALGVAQGTSNIIATSGNISGFVTLTVKPAAVVSISITPTTATIHVHATQAFDAQAQMTDGTTADITSLSTTTWNSDNTAVATISNTAGLNGVATGVFAGTAHITASSSNGVNGTITSNLAVLTVNGSPLVSIAVTPLSPTITIGTDQQFDAIGTYADHTTQDITTQATWASDNINVASVTQHTGLAVGLTVGTANITASQSGITSPSDLLTVNVAGLVSIQILPGSPQIALGTSLGLKAIGTFNNGSTLDITTQVTWTSTATAIATVGLHTGLVRAVSPGTTTITSALNGITESETFTVSNATITSVTVTPSNRTVPVGVRLSYTAIGTFTDSTTQTLTNGTDVTWTSSNPLVATATSIGVVTAVAPGTATITATFVANTSFTGSTTLTVTGATLQSIAVTPLAYVLAPASTVGYTAIGTYSDSTTQNISGIATWTSSDTTVATMSGPVATGVGEGSTNISAALNGITSNSGQLIVEGSPLVSIAVTPSSITLPQQVSTHFRATGTFGDHRTQDLTNFVNWTAVPSNVATISNAVGTQGQATTGTTAGTATINAVYGGQLGQASLTVTSATLLSITVTPPSASIANGTTQAFRATGTFSDQSTLDLTTQVSWTSNNGAVAVINSAGIATGTGAGTAIIKATFNGQTDTATLTVH